MRDLKYKYRIYIYWSDEDNVFIAEIPELPGCMSDGETYEEAIKNAQEAIEIWVETAKKIGREIPKPVSKRELVIA